MRSCFQPDLAGLHVRIYQFRELLRHNLPGLSTHLDDLQVDPAYVSQWFLSFFAVTCPLPMLFRIYDILLAEGATETFMRVGLALMRRNEARLQACTELEDAMQILLSRGIWDPYSFDADAFVQDVTNLTPTVSGERLRQLELSYAESKRAAPAAPAAHNGSARGSGGGVRVSDIINSAAARFLGRNLASPKSPKPTLSPGLGPAGMLRRSNSKQSLASTLTLNSMEAASSVASSTSTVASSVSRDSANSAGDQRSPSSLTGNTIIANSNRSGSTAVSSSTERPSAGNNEGEKNLHGQIEDLLTALSELQRNHAALASQLKQERHERAEDKEAVRSLVKGLGRNGIISGADADTQALLRNVQERFGVRTDEDDGPRMLPTKAELNEDLSSTRERLAKAEKESREYSRRIYDIDQEMTMLKRSVREGHAHARGLLQDKQRLEKQVHTMRNRRPSATPSTGAEKMESAEKGKTLAVNSGLREFKLGQAAPAAFGRRSSSLRGENVEVGEDDLLGQLVQA
ncbi:MAG: hypothetical protein IMZ46_20005, partial [Acidobacteria bacterium]|nr:hypothetical protein [Acidobacteriota bacterium]